MNDVEFIKEFAFKKEILLNMDCFRFIPMICRICNIYGISLKWNEGYPDTICTLELDLSEHDKQVIEEYEKERGKFMTRKEYEEYKNKINEYTEKKKKAEKCRESAKLIKGGVLAVDCAYANMVSICDFGNDTKNKLEKLLCDFFEQEALALEKSMEEL